MVVCALTLSRSLTRRTTRAAAGLLTVSALILTGCTGGDGDLGAGSNNVTPAIAEQVDAITAEAMEASRSTQAVVGVWMPDGSSYVTSYGDRAPSPDAPIRAAETTAPMACAALMQLIATDEIDPDAEVGADLARQTGIEGITYRQLCDGTSGLADYAGAYRGITVNNPARPWNPNELIAQGLTQSPLPGAGEDVYISNTDLVLLGRALRAVTASTNADTFERLVFDPANMDHSRYPQTEQDGALPGAMNALITPSSGGEPVCDVDPIVVKDLSHSYLSTAGGTITTAEDLHAFYTQFFAKTYGGSAVFDDMFQPKSLHRPKRDASGTIVEPAKEPGEGEAVHEYAMGFERVGSMYGRSGELPGTMTSAFIEPESGMMVFIALNNSGASLAIPRAAGFALAAAAAAEAGVSLEWTVDPHLDTIRSNAVCAS